MLSLQNLALRAGTKLLLDKANLSIHPNQKIGIVGQNGVGKTTLFKTIMNEVPIDAGQLNIPAHWQIGCVEQELADGQVNMLDFVCFGDTLYQQATQAIRALEAHPKPDNQALVQAYDQLDKISGYQVPNQAKQLLFGLGFSDSDLDKSVAAFSGGWQVRLKLARALMQRSDLLLLDEPTNHLDIEAVSWLEQWLQSYEGAVLIISHDRDFLDQVVEGIAHVHNQKIYYYAGNFAAFERQRNEQLMQQQALHEKQKQQMQHLRGFISRFRAQASKAKQAQSRIKALERMEEVAAVQASNPFYFSFYTPDHQPDPMIHIKEVSFGYATKTILENVDLVLRAGDRIGLVGVNGSGKTTLLRQIVGELKPHSGKIKYSKGVKVGYFAQHQVDLLHYELSPLQHLLKHESKPSDQVARDFLGGFGFKGDQCLEQITQFSGGEKARLALALVVFEKPNLLILDEPTNHLDMETRDALDMAIQDFSGAIIVVSHDKHLLASIADQFWWIHAGKVTRYEGDLDAYLQFQLKQIKQRQNSTTTGLTEDTKSKKSIRQASAQQRKTLEAQIRAPKKQAKKLETKMAQLEEELASYHQKMEDESLYESHNREALAECIQQEAKLSEQLSAYETEWLTLEEKIEAIKNTINLQD